MRATAAFATALLVTAGLTPAVAAPKKKKAPPPPPPACNLVKDAAGDAANDFEGVDVFQNDASLDIVGGDVATGARTVTAVLRLSGKPEAKPTYVSRYIAEFSVAGLTNKVVLAAGVGLDETRYNYGYYAADPQTGNPGYYYPGTATGSIDGTTVKITANLADLAGNENIGAIKKNAKITGIRLATARRVPPLVGSPRGQLISADDATSRTTYYAGQPHCLKPA